jgi:2-keto-4-pentenoate hydratase/2-oxohepta-3-ene-1,7-dioic acid hydratase in catechol pathway
LKLATYEQIGPFPTARVGVVHPSGIVDVSWAEEAFLSNRYSPSVAARIAEATVPSEMTKLLAGGSVTLERIQQATTFVLEKGVEQTPTGYPILQSDADVRLLAPVLRPPGIACFTVWPQHIKDSADRGYSVTFPTESSGLRPYYKGNPDSVVGPNVPLVPPPYADEIDVECELAAIVGTVTKNVDPATAEQAIAGYCIFNDVSARARQIEEMKMGLGPTKGKDMDGGNVLGPYLVTSDEIPDIRELTMHLFVNGEEWSNHPTGEMAWDFAELLSYLSSGQTIQPGHILTSGCYPGGSALDLERKITPGDVVELRISNLGSLVNAVESRPAW